MSNENRTLEDIGRHEMLKNVREELHRYEIRHAMSSEEALRRYEEGTLIDTGETYDWVLLYRTYRAMMDIHGDDVRVER